MTEREKMIEIVLAAEITGIKIRNITGGTSTANAIADAFIAAGYGDVTEWKEKVECAKRILQIPTLPNGKTDLSYFEYKGECIQDIARQRDEYRHRTEVAERAFNNTMEVFLEILSAIFPDKDIDIDEWKKDYLANAEKELAGEEE